MYNLLVTSGEWDGASASVPRGRTLESTTDSLQARFDPNGKLNAKGLIELPALFVTEMDGDDTEAPARVGKITAAEDVGKYVEIEYTFDPDIAPIPNRVVHSLARELKIDVKSSIDEFHRNHWAVKDVDLFKVLLKHNVGTRPKTKVFTLSDDPPDPNLVALMIPFDAAFKPVHTALKKAAEAAGMKLQRADDIWVDDHIIQDVVTLLCRAKVVICDLTGRNANVFYEMGIAHTLPREVIMITQDSGDVPFDVAHIRYVRYLNNTQGRSKLVADVRNRLEKLKSAKK